jgi:hypothetical protein
MPGAAAAVGAPVARANFTFQQPPVAGPGGVPGGGYRDPFGKAAGSSGSAARAGQQRAGGAAAGAAAAAAAAAAGNNLMHDRRVIRGNTYAAQVVPVSAQAELQRAEEEAAKARARERTALRRTQQEAARAAELQRARTPDAAEGRRHMVIQTEPFLEELKEKVDEVVQETQTDPMLDRPPTPKFVPLRVGRDAETQIQRGDLFNFDTEVDPILDAMVGKTLEQAMLEVQQEEEIEAMRKQKVDFEQRRKEEVLEAQRLEAAERRKFDEKERRKKQEIGRILRERETREKLCARMFSKAFLGTLELRVLSRLQDEGWFHDAVQREVETEFVPWLYAQTGAELDKARRAQRLVDELIRAAVLMRPQDQRDD